MNRANFIFVPGLDRRLPTTILHRWVFLQLWKTTAEVALVFPSCMMLLKRNTVSLGQNGASLRPIAPCMVMGCMTLPNTKSTAGQLEWCDVGLAALEAVMFDVEVAVFSILEAKILILPEELKTSHVPQITGVPCDLQRNARSFVKSFLDYMGEVTVSGSQNSLQHWQPILFKYLWIWWLQALDVKLIEAPWCLWKI